MQTILNDPDLADTLRTLIPVWFWPYTYLIKGLTPSGPSNCSGTPWIVDFAIILTNAHGLKRFGYINLNKAPPDLQTPWYLVKQTAVAQSQTVVMLIYCFRKIVCQQGHNWEGSWELQ